jgi:hypothetical protein
MAGTPKRAHWIIAMIGHGCHPDHGGCISAIDHRQDEHSGACALIERFECLAFSTTAITERTHVWPDNRRDYCDTGGSINSGASLFSHLLEEMAHIIQTADEG